MPVAGLNARSVPDLKGQSVVLNSTDGLSVAAVVADVKSIKRRGDAHTPGTEQISMTLWTTEPDTPAGTYRIEGQDIVLEPLYLSPVGPEGRDRRLEAVITRIA